MTTFNGVSVSGTPGVSSTSISGEDASQFNSAFSNAACITASHSATSGQSTGINATTQSTTDFTCAVEGVSWGSTGQVRGVYGSSNSASGTGVYGTNSNGGLGIYGSSSGDAAKFISSGSGIAVTGQSTSYIGVYGSGGSSSYSGFFGSNATFYVQGYIQKSGGGYFIDHPADPANKYLNHCFVESPEMLNIYRGRVVLDSNGEAVINLPSYFEISNELPQYMLTAIGAAMPNLHVSEEINAGAFKVSGGVAGKSVSWQVTAARADKWAKANHPGVEIDKGAAAGTFIHPELHGQDASKSLDEFVRNRK